MRRFQAGTAKNFMQSTVGDVVLGRGRIDKVHQLFHIRIGIGHLNKQRSSISQLHPLQWPPLNAAVIVVVAAAGVAVVIVVVVVREVETADDRNAHGRWTVG